jgi:peptidoglycan/LPS O-acetylase OafA/YrhL
LKSNNNYRADIDGLRALAVISVILFHISPTLLTGGFLGVDIFFVISGYLITGILIKDVLRNKKIDWLGFYKRRILRIFPALISVVSVTLIASYLILTPDDFLHLSASAFASLFSMANIFFYMFVDTGYFAADTAELPLLHLWSLGVEEQFYIIWPFIVFALLTFLVKRRYILTTITVISVLSLSAAQILLFSDFALSYYMLPTRAWELMFGGWLAH